MNLVVVAKESLNLGGQWSVKYLKSKSAVQPGLTGKRLLLFIFTPSQFPLRKFDTNCTVTKSQSRQLTSGWLLGRSGLFFICCSCLHCISLSGDFRELQPWSPFDTCPLGAQQYGSNYGAENELLLSWNGTRRGHCGLKSILQLNAMLPQTIKWFWQNV